jgi:hypothetical protein
LPIYNSQLLFDQPVSSRQRITDHLGRIMAILSEERVMQNRIKRSEHYREKAAKYYDLANRTHPPYLGEFYRGIAVRYVAMARELSQRADNELQRARQGMGAPAHEVSRQPAQDLDLLAVWAKDNSDRFANGPIKRGQAVDAKGVLSADFYPKWAEWLLGKMM